MFVYDLGHFLFCKKNNITLGSLLSLLCTMYRGINII